MILLKNSKVLIFLILLLATLLRLPLLGDYPTGLTVDEVGQGMSAYSILKTGRDEWGDFWPLNPRGYGDYKPPVYSYLIVPFIAVFGLTHEAVRLPSATAGILTVLVVYLLVLELYKRKSYALFSALILAVLPWHVYHSRLGWESNAAVFFLSSGCYLFFLSLRRNIFLPLSALSFGIAMITYHSVKVITPLIVISLIIIFWKKITSPKKTNLIFAGIIGLIFSLIVIYGFIFSGAGRRASDQALSNPENLIALRQIQITDPLPQPWGRVINSKFEYVSSKFAENYLGYFSTTFLFSPNRSDSSILNFPGKGLLYIWQFPLLLLGLVFLFKDKSKASIFVAALLLITPIPASMSRDYMQAGRSEPLILPLSIISGLGLGFLFSFIKDKRFSWFLAGCLTWFVIWSLVIRTDDYLAHTFNKQLGGLNQGYKEIIEYSENNKNKYNKIIFTKVHSEPHAYVAFYSKMDPQILQQYSQTWKYFEPEGLRYLDMIDYKLDRYEFKNIEWHKVKDEPNALVIADPKELPDSLEYKFVVKDQKGKIVFVAVDTNEEPQ